MDLTHLGAEWSSFTSLLVMMCAKVGLGWLIVQFWRVF